MGEHWCFRCKKSRRLAPGDPTNCPRCDSRLFSLQDLAEENLRLISAVEQERRLLAQLPSIEASMCAVVLARILHGAPQCAASDPWQQLSELETRVLGAVLALGSCPKFPSVAIADALDILVEARPDFARLLCKDD